MAETMRFWGFACSECKQDSHYVFALHEALEFDRGQIPDLTAKLLRLRGRFGYSCVILVCPDCRVVDAFTPDAGDPNSWGPADRNAPPDGL